MYVCTSRDVLHLIRQYIVCKAESESYKNED